MLIYTENQEKDLSLATIHNLDTGVTYQLEVLALTEPDEIVYRVLVKTAGDHRGIFAYKGQEAVDFWKALLFLQPYSSSGTAPWTFIARVLGAETAEPVAEADIPF